MKTLQILVILILSAVQLRASNLLTEFSLKLQQPVWFNVKLGNQLFENPVKRFELAGVPAGHQYLEVTRLEHGYYGPYTVPITVFCGNIYLAPGSRTNFLIDRFGNLRILDVIALHPAWYPQPYIPECAPAPVYGMNEMDFERLKNTVDNLSFESSKIKVIKQALQHHPVTSAQVSELLYMMTFDSIRLDLAKFAYHKTIDKHNYFIINDAFTFESSIEDLNEYINHS